MLSRREQPSFCIISPTAYLQQYATQSNTHLVLAHVVDKNPEYADFYLRRSELGDFVICDNGAFELQKSYHPERLIEIGKRCGAAALVLPDYPFQPSEVTIQAARQWIPSFKDAGFKTFFVPQSERGNLTDWMQCYFWGAFNSDIDIIGMSILGIPAALPHIPPAYARVVMSQLLIYKNQFNFNKFHHYLGLNAGPNLEIPALIKMKALDTCDSSGPVWAGICGHRYTKNSDSYQASSKIQKVVDFDYPFIRNSSVLDDIQHNLDLTLSLFG